MQVVFHLNDLEKWAMAKGNITNLLAVDPTIIVALVVNGSAIHGYFSKEHQAFFERLPVAFSACRNALKGNGLLEVDLPPTVKAVAAGVYTLVELQAQGYAYIKV